MNFFMRHIGITLAGLLALISAILLTFADYYGRANVVIAIPELAEPAPKAVVPPPVHKVARKRALTTTPPLPKPAEARGARLKEKGEALGGKAPGRTDPAVAPASTPQ